MTTTCPRLPLETCSRVYIKAPRCRSGKIIWRSALERSAGPPAKGPLLWHTSVEYVARFSVQQQLSERCVRERQGSRRSRTLKRILYPTLVYSKDLNLVQNMGSDLYSAGLLVRHELSGSVAVPHAEEDQVKVNKSTTPSMDINQLFKHADHHHDEQSSSKFAREIGTDYSFKREIVWFNAIGFLVLHLCGVYGTILMFAGYAKVWTTLYCEFL